MRTLAAIAIAPLAVFPVLALLFGPWGEAVADAGEECDVGRDRRGGVRLVQRGGRDRLSRDCISTT